MQGNSILVSPELHSAAQSYSLYCQFRCKDKHYQQFLDLLRNARLTPFVLEKNTTSQTIYKEDELSDDQIWGAKETHPTHVFLTVSRKAAARINRVVLDRCFADAQPLSDTPLDNTVETFYPYKGMQVMITRNLDKASGVVNGQMATILDNHGHTLILQLRNSKNTFTYPITTLEEDEEYRTLYAMVPSYAMTISKSEGATIDQLVVWMDCPQVPMGLGYVALSRVRCLRDIHFLTPLRPHHFTPVE